MKGDCYVYLIEQKGSPDSSSDVPLYVGMGRGDRMHYHLRIARKGIIAKNGCATEKQQYLIELLRNNVPVELRKLKDGLTRQEAYDLEMQFIALYGRRGLGTGPLLNANAGGHGGRDPIPSSLARMSAAQRGRKLSVEERERISAMNCGRKHTPESRANMAASGRSRWTPELREKAGALNRGKKFTPEHRAKIAAALRGRQGVNAGKKFSPEHAAKIAAALRGRKHTPEAKAKMSAARRARACKPQITEKLHSGDSP